MERKYFSDVIMMQFEDDYFSVPCGYDVYLKQMYGDYMQLPPIEERIVPHDVDVYWR